MAPIDPSAKLFRLATPKSALFAPNIDSLLEAWMAPLLLIEIVTGVADAPAIMPETLAPCCTLTVAPFVFATYPSESLPVQVTVPKGGAGSGEQSARAGVEHISATMLALARRATLDAATRGR